MKIQCPCGAKYVVDITPEMANRPVQFICQGCGLDSSAAVTEMIHRELGQVPAGILIPEAAVAAPPQAVAPAPARMRVAQSGPAVAPPAPESPADGFCLKHPGESFTDQCMVCNKPMCPKCMEIFGHVCSPFCKRKAEAQRMKIPVYAGQKSFVEKQHWRKVGLRFGAAGFVVLLLISIWFWYAWFGSTPRSIFSVHFEKPTMSGESVLCDNNQLIVLRGNTLGRYDLKSGKAVWSHTISDTANDAVTSQMKTVKALVRKAGANGAAQGAGMPSEDEIMEMFEDSFGSGLQLYVQGSNVWVSANGKLVQYDWASGAPGKQVDLKGGRIIRHQEELLTSGMNNVGQHVITRINLATAETRSEEIGDPIVPPTVAGKPGATPGKKPGDVAANQRAAPTAARNAVGSRNQPLDPGAIEAQASRLSLPEKIALPAVLATSFNQERTMAEIDDVNLDYSSPGNPVPHAIDYGFFLPSRNGSVEVFAKVVTEKFVTQQAMKAPPKKSALDGNVNVTQSMEVANEILNEMQRSRGGDTITVNESIYRVTIGLPGTKVPNWSAEMNGPPKLCVLQTVNVVSAGVTLIVLDKKNTKRWESKLSHPLGGMKGNSSDEPGNYGEGPCVERGDSLYVIDEAVLTAFDLATGNVRWRLPSVGVAGIFFDEKGMLYVNTTTGTPDDLKYSRQIDMTRKTSDIILKVDPKSGKTLWNVHPGGFISAISGKFIYIVGSNDAGMAFASPIKLGSDMPSYVKIKRLNPSNGKIMWEHYQANAPLDVKFRDNTIQIIFQKDVQVLKFLSL